MERKHEEKTRFILELEPLRLQYIDMIKGDNDRLRIYVSGDRKRYIDIISVFYCNVCVESKLNDYINDFYSYEEIVFFDAIKVSELVVSGEPTKIVFSVNLGIEKLWHPIAFYDIGSYVDIRMKGVKSYGFNFQ